MATELEYLDLITSEHRDKPIFISTLSLDVSPCVRVQNLLLSMIDLFDVDLAVGEQLDFIGKWVGISRQVNIPLTDVYFAWDGTDDAVGWDYGIWQSPLDPGTITVLPDDVYRNIIKQKIAANSWDGTTTGAYEIWDALFTTVTILIIDHQDMSYDIAFVGGIVDSLTRQLIVGGYFQLKPEAVRINEYIFPIDSGPLFGWDLDTDYVQGWDAGSWGIEVSGS